MSFCFGCAVSGQPFHGVQQEVNAVHSSLLIFESEAVATPNYSYEKRQKELAKKRKKEDKLKRKAEGKPEDGGDAGDDADGPAAPPAPGLATPGTGSQPPTIEPST